MSKLTELRDKLFRIPRIIRRIWELLEPFFKYVDIPALASAIAVVRSYENTTLPNEERRQRAANWLRDYLERRYKGRVPGFIVNLLIEIALLAFRKADEAEG